MAFFFGFGNGKARYRYHKDSESDGENFHCWGLGGWDRKQEGILVYYKDGCNKDGYILMSHNILRPTLKRQDLTLLQGIRCVGSTVLSPHVPAENFAAGGPMWTDCTRVPMTDSKPRVGWGIIRSYGKGLRVG
jgi:hypothetical protein